MYTPYDNTLARAPILWSAPMAIERVMKVAADGDEYLKISWRDENNMFFPPYAIFRHQIEAAAKECRSALEALCDEHIDSEEPDFSSSLRSLATAGSHLWFLLFDGCAPADRERVRKIRNWLTAAQPERVRLRIAADASSHIPWALTYEGNPDSLPDTVASPDQYSDFWCFKYSISVNYSGMEPKNFTDGRSAACFRVLTALSDSEFERAKTYLSPTDKELLEQILRRPVGVARSFREWVKKLEEVGGADCLLHFYSHSSGTSINLADDDEMSVVSFKLALSQSRENSNNHSSERLLFLNGCKTAVGDLDNGFLVASAEPGLCGLVGAEASVPADFALRYSVAFLRGLLEEGQTVQQIVDCLRHELWPLSLLYGCYAHPQFHLASATTISPQTSTRL